MKLGMSDLKLIIVCSNDDPGVTLIYFTAMSNLVTMAFLLEKVKTVDFSETIAACDLKSGRCRQLIEIMSIEGQGHFFTIYFSRFCMVCALLGQDIR